MEHSKIKELVQLYACDELSRNEIELVENHLLECEECSKEYSSMKQLYFAFTENSPEPVGEHLINQARENLMETLYQNTNSDEIEKVSLIDKLVTLVSTPLRLSLASAMLLVIGVLIGKFTYAPGMPNLPGGIDLDNPNMKSIDIANVRFIPSGDNGDEVEIFYNNVTPVVYKGSLNDKNVQNLLARAIVAGDNPGIRIKSLNAIAEKSQDNFTPDENVKLALIEALKIDDNAGVRKQALNVLISYPLDSDIQKAFLHVLSNDNNPGLRVMAINALAEMKSQGTPISGELLDILSNKAQNDDNSFVRLKAANLIEGDN